LLAFLKFKKAIFFALSMIFLAAGFAQFIGKASPQMNEMMAITPPGVINVSAWLKNHVRADEALIVSNDRHDCFQTNIMLRSGIHFKRCLLLSAPVFESGLFINKKTFEQYIWKHRTDYLVLNSESYLQKILSLDLSKKRQDLGDAVFEAAFEENVPGRGRYIIYRISYRESPGDGGHA